MTLNEQLAALVTYGKRMVAAGEQVETVQMFEYTHECEEVVESVHSAGIACRMDESYEQAVLAGMQWVVDAIRSYGLPDDLNDLPLTNFPPDLEVLHA